jgi:transcriptional regulator
MLTEKEWKVLVLRKEGLLQSEIAKHLDITQGAVSRFEANAREKIAVAQRELSMLKRLGIDTQDATDDELEARLKDLKKGVKR